MEPLPSVEPHNPPAARDNQWLSTRLSLIRTVHFADVPTGFPIDIRFGTRARYRFGSISARNGRTLILINRLFADPIVPNYVIDSTIAHEMAHYAHGFGSGLPRLYVDPHRGGVVDLELEKRGCGEATRLSEKWREACWDGLYQSRCGDLAALRSAREATGSELWQRVLGRPDARSAEWLRERTHLILKRTGAPAGSPVFEVGWLEASIKQRGTSYWFHRTGVLRLHGLLADPRVPVFVIDFELGYWVMRRQVGSSWPVIQLALKRAGLEKETNDALRWRRAAWTSFRNRNHPLR